MSAIVHLEPIDFVKELYKNQKSEENKLRVSPYVLDDGQAGMVYMFNGLDGNIYYLDRIFTGNDLPVQEDPETLHADIYRKVALDQRLKGMLA